MTRILILVISAFALLANDASAAGRNIENESLSVTVSDDAAITVIDKRCGHTWTQRAPGKATTVKVADIEKTGVQSISLSVGDGIAAVIALHESKPEVSVTISPSNDGPKMSESDRFDFPYAFLPLDKDSEIVWPNRAGALYPVTELAFGPKPWVVGGGELLMCWFGVLDSSGEAGMMAIVDTPDDAHVEFVGNDELWSPAVRWLPSRGHLRYPRRLIYCFFDSGGYVAQAKRYRSYVIENREFRTLREKVEQNPFVDKLIGGVNARIIHNNVGLSRKYLMRLPEYGVTKGSLCMRAKDDREGVMRDDVVSTLIADGFLLTHWYTTAWALPNTPASLLTPQYMKNPKFSISRNGGYITKSSKKAGGTIAELPETGFTRLCSHAYLDKVTQFIERMNAMYPLKPKGFSATGSLKIDMLCEDLFECYAPDHPLTRSRDKSKRIEMLRILKERGYVLSAEGGNDWQVPYIDTAYDPLGLKRSQSRKIASASWSIKYPVDPKIGPKYDEYYFGAARRVPLYDLVYHDCIVSTMHDGDSFNMYYKTCEEDARYWRLKELFSILHGQPPNVYLTVDDFFMEQHERIKQSIDIVCPWHEKVGYDEMTDHKYLTTDRMVQQTCFASGWTAIVNFSKTETFTTGNGKNVKPLDFLLFRQKKD